MTMSRRWLVGLVALALACAVLAVAFGRSDPIGPAGYRRVLPGMTSEEVRAAIGRPPGDYYTGPRGPTGQWGSGGSVFEEWGRPPAVTVTGDRGRGETADGEELTIDEWWGNGYGVEAYFGGDGKVVGAALVVVDVPGLADRLYWWLAGVRSRIGL